MPLVQFANNAASTFAGAISNIATTANLQSGSGVLFPAPVNGQYFCLTLLDAATGLLTEIVHVTGVAGDTITMVRGQEGTIALNWLPGDLVVNDLTAGQMSQMGQFLVFAGNPNGHVAGTAAVGNFPPTFLWDTTNQDLWTCVLSGNSTLAQWVSLSSSGLIAPIGYKIFPDGLIFQWGNVVIGASNPLLVVFPVAFPNAPFSLTMTDNFASTWVLTNSTFYGVSGLSTTGFSAWAANWNGTTVDIRAPGPAYHSGWLAVGH